MKVKEIGPVQSKCPSIVSSSTPIDLLTKLNVPRFLTCTDESIDDLYQCIDESKRNWVSSVKMSLNSVILQTYYQS